MLGTGSSYEVAEGAHSPKYMQLRFESLNCSIVRFRQCGDFEMSPFLEFFMTPPEPRAGR